MKHTNEEQLSAKEKLNLETAIIRWADLQLYFAQGKLIIVDQQLDLIDCAASLAENNVDTVDKMIQRKQIDFASVDWIRENCQPETELWAVVVAPYVVAQLKKPAS